MFEFLFVVSTSWIFLTHKDCNQTAGKISSKSDYFAFCCTKIIAIQFWILTAAESSP